MKNIVAICKLRLLQLKNNRKQLLLLMLLPSLSLYFVQLFVAETIEQAKLPIAFVDEDKSELSQALANSLAMIDALHVIDKRYDEAEQLLFHQDVDLVVYVEAGFEERILTAETNALVTLIHSPMSLSIGVMKEVVAANVMRFASNSLAADYVLDLAKEYSPAPVINEEILFSEAWEKTNAQWEPSPPLELVVLGDEVMSIPIQTGERQQGESGLFLLVTMIFIVGAYLAMLSLDYKENALMKRLCLHRATKLQLFFGHLSAIVLLLIAFSILPTFIMMTINTSRLLLSLLVCILFSALLFYNLSTLFVRKSLFAASSGLFILSSLLLSVTSNLSPQRVVHSFNQEEASFAFFCGYFGIGIVISLLFLIIANRWERDQVC